MKFLRAAQNTLAVIIFLKVLIFVQLVHAQTSPLEISEYNRLKAEANQNTVTIVSGGTSTAQIQFATDLADILNEKEGRNQSLRVLPVIGKGGHQNALDILYLKGVDMAIIQTDTLAYLRGQKPALYKNVQDRIHYITKLYNAEWHVIASQKIKTLKDLEGKNVNISKKFSGTYIASKTILELLGINVNYVTDNDAVALEKLQSGKIDAVAILAGVPVNTIQNIPRDSGLHFVPVDFFFQENSKVPFKFVLEYFYLPTNLKHDTYPNLVAKGGSVPTVASSTILAVYNWPKKTGRYKKVSKFIKQFFEKFERFKQPGRHPKWQEVNLSANIPYWKKFAAVNQQLSVKQRGDKVSRTGANSLLNKFDGAKKEMFENFMNFVAERKYGVQNYKQLNSRQQNQIYSDFLKMTESSKR